MIYTRLDKDNHLDSININQLYLEILENTKNNEAIEIGVNPEEIYIFVETDTKDLQYMVSVNDYYSALINNLTNETIAVVLAPQGEKDIAQVFISEVYRVAGYNHGQFNY